MSGSPFDERVAATYEDWYASPWGRLADELETAMILELLEPVAPPATVLDAGCGTGHFAEALAGRGYRVVGIDLASAMLGRARERVPVAAADGLRLPFADGSFDAAVSVSVLEFTAEPEAHLDELRRVARERVVVLTLNPRSYLGLRRRLAGLKGHPVFRRVRAHARGRLAPGAVARRGALSLPPFLGARLAGLERQLARGRGPAPGIVGFAFDPG